MKLRQRLAMVLASAMVLTAVPVTTMAASTNSFNKTLSVAEGTYITTDTSVKAGQELDLIVQYTDDVTRDEFYLIAEDFTFDTDAYADVAVYSDATHETPVGTVKANSSTELVVTVDAEEEVVKLYIPIAGTVNEGTPSITVDAVGSFASTSTLTFGEVVESDTLVASVDGDPVSIVKYDSNEITTLASIKIEEKVTGALAGKTVNVELENREFIYADEEEMTVTLDGAYGLADITVTATVDEDVLSITFPEDYASTRPGYVVITGIEVEAEDDNDDYSEGDVEVVVWVDDVMDETELVVAEVVDESISISIEDADDVATLVAGMAPIDVNVVITQNGDIVSRDVDLTVENAYFLVEVTEDDETTWEKVDSITIDSEAFEDEDGAVVKEVTQEVRLAALPGTSGEIVITATSRSFDDLEVEVTDVVEAFEYEVEEKLIIRPGVKDETGGEIVITEDDVEQFADGTTFVISKADADDDFDITGAELVVDGDIEAEISVADDVITVTVTNESDDEAGTLTIKNIEVTSKGYLAEGEYDLVLGGTGISTDLETDQSTTITLEGFVATEGAVEAEKVEVEVSVGSGYAFNDENGRMLAQLKYICDTFGVTDYMYMTVEGVGVITIFKDGTTIQFMNGSNQMSVNGGVQIMDTAATIIDGRTYVPVRFLANALGLTVANYEDGVATITN